MRPSLSPAACACAVLILTLNWPAALRAGCLPDADTLWIAPRTGGLVFDTPHEACARADFTVWCGAPVGGGPLGSWSPNFCAFGCNPPAHCPYNPGWLRVNQAAHRCAGAERWDGRAQACVAAPTPDTGRPRCGLARGNPVHVGTGNKFESERDFHHRQSPLLAVHRYYNSRLGRWRFSFEQSLRPTWQWSDGAGYLETVVLERADGRGLSCPRDAATGRYRCAADRRYRIEALDDADSAEAWEVSLPGGLREWYDRDGRLLRIRDAAGAQLLQDYDLAPGQGGDGDGHTVDRLRDGRGNTVMVVQSAAGVAALITADGERYDYLRRGDGLLTRVRYPVPAGAAPAERRYLYDDPRHPAALTGIVDELGERSATWAYDESGRVVNHKFQTKPNNSDSNDGSK